MFKKIRLEDGHAISVATALVICAIDELVDKEGNAGAVYGYQIMNHLQKENKWNVKSGTVYPILKKLEDDGLIHMKETMSDASKRPRFFYSLTENGRKLTLKLKSLNQNELDDALNENVIQTSVNDQSHSIFSENDFTEKNLVPFLEDLRKYTYDLISAKKTREELEKIQEQLENSIRKLDYYKQLLQSNISLIEQLRTTEKAKMTKL